MRHLGSLILSLVLAPSIWLLTGVGLVEYGQVRSHFDLEPRVELLLGLASLVTAGALFAVLVTTRLSPVGPVLVGLAYLGMVGWATVDRTSLYRTLPRNFLGTDFALTYPAEGYAALLAIPLLATALSPRRWRRFDRVAAVYSPIPTYPAGPGGLPKPAAPPPAAPATEDEATTTRLSVPTFRPPAGPTWPSTPQVQPQPDATEVTVRIGSPANPSPPPAAYPPPGHATPTAPPVDPDVTRQL